MFTDLEYALLADRSATQGLEESYTFTLYPGEVSPAAHALMKQRVAAMEAYHAEKSPLEGWLPAAEQSTTEPGADGITDLSFASAFAWLPAADAEDGMLSEDEDHTAMCDGCTAKMAKLYQAAPIGLVALQYDSDEEDVYFVDTLQPTSLEVQLLTEIGALSAPTATAMRLHQKHASDSGDLKFTLKMQKLKDGEHNKNLAFEHVFMTVWKPRDTAALDALDARCQAYFGAGRAASGSN